MKALKNPYNPSYNRMLLNRKSDGTAFEIQPVCDTCSLPYEIVCYGMITFWLPTCNCVKESPYPHVSRKDTP